MNEKQLFTDSGINIRKYYTAKDIEGLPIEAKMPGVYPYTRGVQADMYRGNYGLCANMPDFLPPQKAINAIIIYCRRVLWA